ncbi:helicase domain-containing protein [Agromyces mangrovi Wang et al. 2018]|uniref:hypothetical protein n=1 Tax=Agromyces mangrovi TaxID=1858653 RepID=UPI003D9AF5C3|nr:hypothetical protein GCM10025877_03990 [Agromyces mangrovi]
MTALQRSDASGWTTHDLPLLDAARRRLGDPRSSRRRREREATLAAEREAMSQTIERLVAAGDDLLSWMDGDDLRNSLVDDAVLPADDPDRLAGPFAHVIVDEAQELTDAEWRMLIARCPSRSITVVGDRAQARHGFAESWEDRLRRVGLADASVATLRVNYRTPAEVMAEAEPVIRRVIADANVPTSVRSTGVPVRRVAHAELGSVLEAWLAAHEAGVACVIGDPSFSADSVAGGAGRVRSLSPIEAKGLEFDLVALVEPDALGDGIEGAVDRYVAMTRATQELVMVDA